MSTLQRWLLAIGLFIGISVITIVFSLGGGVIAVMGVAGCQSGLPDWVMYMLFAAPASVILSALVAAVLVITQARWYWVIGSIGAGVVLGIIMIIGYFVSLSRLCWS